ncbi:hypothetical protein BCR43DRAFT_442170, partial [Syncephalastrum racemosum]
GRQIDLLSSNMKMELGSSEWKKGDVTPSTARQQQVKNARTNEAILRALERMPIDNDNRADLFVLGMDWLGSIGYLFAVQQYDSAYLVHWISDLILPATLSNIRDFKQTLDVLFSCKHRHTRLERIMGPAYHGRKAESILKTCCSPATPKRELSPDTISPRLRSNASERYLPTSRMTRRMIMMMTL